ncbi:MULTISPECIES: hypothetical protein [unclassified Pseudoxanthomonas]|uniref:hypothetical protein n=1 Tax=unclassified Pseudoxanthomonas TaxID=2645906 RepID=UPI003076DD9C
MYLTDDPAGPVEYGPVLMVQGRYQVVELKAAPSALADDPIGYAVITSAGGLVRRELTLNDAKRWATELAEADREPEQVRPTPTTAARKRRR